jgi:hypothetical protein
MDAVSFIKIISASKVAALQVSDVEETLSFSTDPARE